MSSSSSTSEPRQFRFSNTHKCYFHSSLTYNSKEEDIVILRLKKKIGFYNFRWPFSCKPFGEQPALSTPQAKIVPPPTPGSQRNPTPQEAFFLCTQLVEPLIAICGSLQVASNTFFCNQCRIKWQEMCPTKHLLNLTSRFFYPHY